MSNFLVHIRYTVDISEDMAEAWVGREDDGTDDWYGEAAQVVEDRVKSDPPRFLEYVHDDPEVEVT